MGKIKEKVEIYSQSFKDFEGKEHTVTGMVLIMDLPTKETYTDHKGQERESELFYILDRANYDGDGVTMTENIKSALYLDFTICNPKDTYDYATAVKILNNRIKTKIDNDMVEMCFCDGGLISREVMQAIIKRKVEEVISNPGKFIKGYDAKKKIFLRNKQIMNEYNNLDPEYRNAISKKIGSDIINISELKKYIDLFK